MDAVEEPRFRIIVKLSVFSAQFIKISIYYVKNIS